MEDKNLSLKLCVNQFLRNCECTIDRNIDHHPNNFDCPRYKEMTVWEFKVLAKDDYAELVHKDDSRAI